MAAELKPYPAYKDSGVPWLGEVPAHWEVSRLSSIATVVNGYPFDSQYFVKGEGTPLIRIRDLHAIKTEVNYGGAIVEEALIETGDIIVGMDGLFNVARWRGPAALLNQRMCCLRAKNSSRAGFIVRAVELPLKIIGDLAHSTTVKHLSSKQVRNIELGVPPLSEQTAIARFLDHADRRIRCYIHAKEKLIALLEEQKQALIHQAVTGQIDIRTGQPYPVYKPSGVEWLGEVPEHWEVVALRRKWQVIDCKHLTVPFVDGGIPLASVREAQSFELNFKASNRTTPEWYEKLIEGGREPRPGDLIYCRNVSVGAAALVTTEDRFAMGQDVCLIRSSSENQRWLNYFLHSKVMSDQLALLLVGSTFNRINVADIKALLIAVPPVSEQDRIAAVLDEEQSKIAIAIGNCRKEQAILHEYRTRLIADVVTGKLDVREAAVRLPDGEAEPKQFDKAKALIDAAYAER